MTYTIYVILFLIPKEIKNLELVDFYIIKLTQTHILDYQMEKIHGQFRLTMQYFIGNYLITNILNQSTIYIKKKSKRKTN